MKVRNQRVAFELKEKAVSCSILSRTRERKKRFKTGAKKDNISLTNAKDTPQGCSYGKSWRNKQCKLIKKRIDLLFEEAMFKGSGSDTSATECLFRTASTGNLSIASTEFGFGLSAADQTSQSSIADSFVSTSEDLYQAEMP